IPITQPWFLSAIRHYSTEARPLALSPVDRDTSAGPRPQGIMSRLTLHLHVTGYILLHANFGLVDCGSPKTSVLWT
ncbi:hypothetical protein JOQ06_013686, partial [Pogonophryne albipinna]